MIEVDLDPFGLISRHPTRYPRWRSSAIGVPPEATSWS